MAYTVYSSVASAVSAYNRNESSFGNGSIYIRSNVADITTNLSTMASWGSVLYSWRFTTSNSTATITASTFNSYYSVFGLNKIAGDYAIKISSGSLTAVAAASYAAQNLARGVGDTVTVSDSAANMSANSVAVGNLMNNALYSGSNSFTAVINDTFDNIYANLPNLVNLNVGNKAWINWLNVNISDTVTPAKSISADLFNSYFIVLSRIQKTISLTITGGVVDSNALVSFSPSKILGSFAVSDDVWALQSFLPTLDAFGSKITSISVTYGNLSTLSYTAAEYISYKNTFAKLIGTFTLSVSNWSTAVTTTISGSATSQNSVLTATNSLSTVASVQNNVSYNWYADNVLISGASGSLYTLKQSDVGKKISVRASLGGSECITSSLTAVVTNVNDSPAGLVIINGTVTQGQTLTASNTLADLDGLGVVTYTWKANGVAVGTGVNYLLTLSEVGKTITLTASYTDGYGAFESATSSASSIVASLNHLPVGLVSISGLTRQGQTLTVSNTLVDSDGLGVIGYTWLANGTVIGTGINYALTQSEVGKTITVTASYTDGKGYSESVSSAATTTVVNVNDAPTGSVSVSGTAIQGQVVTATNNLVDQDVLGYVSYTWKADGSYIGTGSTYMITQSDIGKTITATASYTDGYGTAESVSSSNSLAVALQFVGSSGNDTFVGLHKFATKNCFIGGGGNDDITGGSRSDVAEYSGNLSNYNISASNGLITIADNRTGSTYDGTDTLRGINLLKFADGMEFVGLAAQRVALTGSEVNHTVQVTENKLYSGTNAAETFVIGSNVSSMILAGEGDTVHLAGSFTDYTYAARGSALQITKGDFMTTVNLAGNVSIETDLGHGLNAKLDFTQATPRVMLDTQWLTAGSIDATLLNTHAVL